MDGMHLVSPVSGVTNSIDDDDADEVYTPVRPAVCCCIFNPLLSSWHHKRHHTRHCYVWYTVDQDIDGVDS